EPFETKYAGISLMTSREPNAALNPTGVLYRDLAAMQVPALLAPVEGARLTGLGTTLSWNPPSGALQYQLQVIPANNDGPGINLIAPGFGPTVGSLTPVLAWQNSDRETFYYEVQVSSDQGFGPDAFLYWELRHGGATTPPNSYTVPEAFPLQPETAYYWRVRP